MDDDFDDVALEVAKIFEIEGGHVIRDVESNRYFAVLPDGGRREIIRTDTKEFERVLGQMYHKYNPTKCLSIHDQKESVRFLENPRTKTIRFLNRLTCYEGRYFYNIHNDQGDVVCIDETSWRLVKEVDLTDVYFRPNPKTIAQVMPVRGEKGVDYLGQFVNMVNIKDEDVRLFLKLTIVSLFIGDINHKILSFSGFQGSGKTTFTKFLKELVDWTAQAALKLPNDTRDSVLHAYYNYVVHYDNVSALKKDFPELFNIMATGGVSSVRALFTDTDTVEVQLRNIIILSGISVVIKDADLLDRSLLFSLDRLEDRVSESEMKERFEKIKPYLLAQIFDAISDAIFLRGHYKETQTKDRFGDWMSWMFSIAQVFDIDSDKVEETNQRFVDKQMQEAMSANTLAYAITRYVTKGRSLLGTPTEVMNELNGYLKSMMTELDDREVFTATTSFGRKLGELGPHLEECGIKVIKTRWVNANGRLSADDINFLFQGKGREPDSYGDRDRFYIITRNPEKYREIKPVD